VIKVLDGVTVLVLVLTVEMEASVLEVSAWDLVGVKVEVVRTTVTESEEVGLWVMVEDSVTTVGEIVGVVITVVVEPLSESEEVGDEVSLVVSLPPVDS